jgi:short subunit dehydrogenase-like uncharacterized protein
MAAENATQMGLHPVLSGRNEKALHDLAARLDCPYRVFNVEDRADVDKALSDVTVLLNCAGPYMRTAEPLMTAAIGSGVHYLDIAAELGSYRLAEAHDVKAAAAGVMLLPGSGGSVAMLGCLTAHTAARVRHPHRLRLALHVAGSMSRGSAISARETMTTQTLHRVDGTLAPRDPNALRFFDFGHGEVACAPVTLPDLITIWRSAHIPNIETYVHASGDAFPDGDPAGMEDGPSAEQREADRYQAVAEVEGEDQVVRSLLDTVNGYTFTPLAAAHATRRVLAGQLRPGFHTPAEIFGVGFAETIADTHIIDL